MASDGYPTECTPANPCPAHGGRGSAQRFLSESFGGPVDDFLVRELTDPDSPEFEGRCHCEGCQRARGIALRACLQEGGALWPVAGLGSRQAGDWISSAP